jgi:hypothetical protein
MTASARGNFELWRPATYCLAFAGVLMASEWSLATAHRTGSGVHGTVTVSPSCPGPARLDKDCVAPYAKAPVQLSNRAGKMVRHTTTAADGTFSLQAPAGHYQLHLQIEGLYPRCETVPVQIRSGRWTEVKLGCDSGMR